MVTQHSFDGISRTFFQVLKWGERSLSETSEEPESDSLRCLEAATSLSKTNLFSRLQDVISDCDWVKFHTFIERRRAGEPLAYILGEAWFRGDLYKLEKGVLIPRHDTEILVQEAIQCCLDHDIKYAVECGFGSGIVSISLAKALPNLRSVAWDISEIAYRVATENGRRLGVDVDWQLGDFFQFQSQWGPLFQSDVPTLFVSNPPYIPKADIDALEPQVKEYEPLLALDGGHDGLDYYRKFLACLKGSKNTWFLAEVGLHQKEALTQLFELFSDVSWYEDLQGIARVIKARFS